MGYSVECLLVIVILFFVWMNSCCIKEKLSSLISGGYKCACTSCEKCGDEKTCDLCMAAKPGRVE